MAQKSRTGTFDFILMEANDRMIHQRHIYMFLWCVEENLTEFYHTEIFEILICMEIVASERKVFRGTRGCNLGYF